MKAKGEQDFKKSFILNSVKSSKEIKEDKGGLGALRYGHEEVARDLGEVKRAEVLLEGIKDGVKGEEFKAMMVNCLFSCCFFSMCSALQIVHALLAPRLEMFPY